MKFLLDTNILSELRKPVPSQQLLKWFSSISNEHLFISAITLGEIKRGIVLLKEGRKKNDLIVWLDRVQKSFQYQTLEINTEVALKWGDLTADSAKTGVTLPAIDGLIAATAYVHGAILVTRNTKDFPSTHIQILNPWL